MVQVQWFPGHMAKTRRLITENLKLVDVVLELADARVPESSRNPLLEELIGAKPRLLILAKKDLADEKSTKEWTKHFLNRGIPVIPVNSILSIRQPKKIIIEEIRKQAQAVLERRTRRGILSTTVRTMVVGIPNVGKSTLINFLAGKGAAETGDKPGVTRGKQWIRLDKDVELLDMPGILWAKIDDVEVGNKLAATGAVSDLVFDRVELALWLITWFLANYPGRLAARYKIAEDLTAHELLNQISKKRRFIKSGGAPDCEKGAIMMIDEFRAGKLGTVTMDTIPPQ